MVIILQMTEEKYIDKIILALREKYTSEQEKKQAIGEAIYIGLNKIPLQREVLFEGRFSILLPQDFDDLDAVSRTVKYRSQNRPQIIKSDKEKNAAISFNLLPAEHAQGENYLIRLKNIQFNMKKIWKQNVFYDEGKLQAVNVPVAWMDFRAFCIEGSFYSLMFLLEAGNDIVLGNFHCSFMDYDIWKPAVLKLLETIQINDETNQLEME